MLSDFFPTSFLLPQFLVLNLMKCGLDVYDNNLSFENFLCYTQVLNTFLTLVLGVLMEREFLELVLESGIVSDFFPVVFGHRYIIKAMNNMPRAGLD